MERIYSSVIARAGARYSRYRIRGFRRSTTVFQPPRVADLLITKRVKLDLMGLNRWTLRKSLASAWYIGFDDRHVDLVQISKRISFGEKLMVFCGNWKNWRKFRLAFWIALAYTFRPLGKSVLMDVCTFFVNIHRT